MTNQNQTSKLSILVLDDDPVMLLFLQEYLKDAYQVHAFESGLQAVDWLTSGTSVDAMLVDLNMPDMDGLSFLEAAQRLPHVAAVPLVILSGSKKSADRVAGLRAGAVDFVGKPFNPDELTARLEIHLAGQSRRRPAVGSEPELAVSMN